MIALALYLIAFFILAVRYSVDPENPYTYSLTFQGRYLLLCLGLDIAVLVLELASDTNVTVILGMLTLLVTCDLLISLRNLLLMVRTIVKRQI